MAAKKVIVYGGRGALGSAIVSHMKNQKFWVGSIDMAPNELADSNMIVTPSDSWTGQAEQVEGKVEEVLNGEKVDAIFCVAGGWAGGNASSKDLIKNSDMMWKQSVWTSVITAQLAAKHLKEKGVVVFTGAHPALEGTAGMIGYGMAKAAVHQMVKSCAAPKSGLPQDTMVAAILPVTLDTPMNRKFMPDADQTTWTPLEYIAKMFGDWMSGKDRPAENGSLVQLITKDSVTQQVVTQ